MWRRGLVLGPSSWACHVAVSGLGRIRSWIHRRRGRLRLSRGRVSVGFFGSGEWWRSDPYLIGKERERVCVCVCVRERSWLQAWNWMQLCAQLVPAVEHDDDDDDDDSFLGPAYSFWDKNNGLETHVL